jgi:hypothetical protein
MSRSWRAGSGSGPAANRRAQFVLALVIGLSACVSQPLPAVLATDANQRAAKFSSDLAVRRRYLAHFALGARDALIWKGDIEEARSSSAEACSGAPDLQLRAVECGYAEGIQAALARQGSVTLEDFGYQGTSVVSRLASADGSPVRFIAATSGKPWLAVSSPAADLLMPDRCYRLDGFLGKKGALDARYERFSREFVIMKATPADSCAAAIVR